MARGPVLLHIRGQGQVSRAPTEVGRQTRGGLRKEHLGQEKRQVQAPEAGGTCKEQRGKELGVAGEKRAGK